MKQPSNPYYSLPQPLSPNVPPIIVQDRDPTSTDSNYNVGQVWVNTTPGTYWALTQNSAGTVSWVDLGIAGTPGVNTLTGNSGGAISPISHNISVVGDGSIISIAGNPANATLTASITGILPVSNGGTGGSSVTGVLSGHGTDPITGSQITPHNVVIGSVNNNLSSISPSATSGVPVISQGSGTNPVFGTATVPGGGTGATSFIPYAPVCGGTLAVNPLQSVASIGTAGQVLTSNGAGALPSFQTFTGAFASITRQVFTSTGTYTPTAGMLQCDIEVVGAGGGGGGAIDAPVTSGGCGGAGGGYAKGVFAAASIGASQSVTIGGGGGGGAGGSGGSTGGTSSVGALISATGGAGGSGGTDGSGFIAGGTGGIGTGGDIQIQGGGGDAGRAGASQSMGGAGGSSYYGGGAPGSAIGANGSGSNGSNGGVYGAGGSGAVTSPSAGNRTGGNGASGIVVITEYVS